MASVRASGIGPGMSPTSRVKLPIGDKAEQAYRRSDALEKRRKLMEAWAYFCQRPDKGKIVPLGMRR